ncbi:MAG: DUF177 domain-containing protein [Chloroflexi bacterium]|nr:DUF177 domain-containing protein [Chloroflexota bacterium]
MQFNVAHLLKGPVGTSEHHELDATFVPIEYSRTDRVWGTLCLTSVNNGVWVSGSLKATAVCTCSRCLKDFPIWVQFDLDEIYRPVVEDVTGTPLAASQDVEPGFTIDEHHHVLDITEAVRQSTIVALPMKPLCRDSCAGLCPECGGNRNEAGCTCQGADIDPRWRVLLGLANLGRA